MITQLTSEDERRIRRWLINVDPDLALHRQLKDYFLAPTASFGTLAVQDGESKIRSLCFFSKYNGTAFIHNLTGRAQDLEEIRVWLDSPCQAFLRDEHVPSTDSKWVRVLDVVPGLMVNHPAYDGVFSRTVPRFKGAVYEHE